MRRKFAIAPLTCGVVNLHAQDNNLYWSPINSLGDHCLIYYGSGNGEVVFYRGNEAVDEDGGAYQLLTVWTPSGSVARYFNGTRIQFHSLTVR